MISKKLLSTILAVGLLLNTSSTAMFSEQNAPASVETATTKVTLKTILDKFIKSDTYKNLNTFEDSKIKASVKNNSIFIDYSFKDGKEIIKYPVTFKLNKKILSADTSNKYDHIYYAMFFSELLDDVGQLYGYKPGDCHKSLLASRSNSNIKGSISKQGWEIAIKGTSMQCRIDISRKPTFIIPKPVAATDPVNLTK